MPLLLSASDYFLDPSHEATVFWRRHGIACLPHSHPYHEIILVLRGSAVHVVEGVMHPFSAGQVLLVRAGQTHHYRQVEDLEMVHVLLRGPAALFSGLAALDSVAEPAAGTQALYRGHLYLAAADFATAIHEVQALERAEPGSASVQSAVVALLALLTLQGIPLPPQPIEDFWVKERLVTPACQYLEENFLHPISLDGIAAAAGATPRTLSRWFQTVTGRSPFMYLHGLRLHHAMLQLRHTRKDIMEVALDVGFNDLSFFIRKFKALTGVPPSVWRQHRGNEW